MDGSYKTISEDTTTLQLKPKIILHSDSDNNLKMPLFNMDLSANSNPNLPQHHPRTQNKELKSPTHIMEPSDIFLDPNRYNRFSISTDVDDTFQERIAKKMEIIKDVTRDRAVVSITAGENAVYWLVNCFKYLTSGWLGLIIILIIIVVYGLLGALIFMLLEAPNEQRLNDEMENKTSTLTTPDIRQEVSSKIAIKLESILKNKTMMVTNTDILPLIQDDLMAFENKYSEYIKNAPSNVSTLTWDFANSFIFAGTIFTTIGYGHIAPKTMPGRAATMIYAIIGIPLFLIVLTSFGKFLTRLIKFFWAYIFCGKHRLKAEQTESLKVIKNGSNTKALHESLQIEDKNEENIGKHIERKNETNVNTPTPSLIEIEIDEDTKLPITLALSILILYMICGAVMIWFVESWSFFESFYCVFISMSTIGLGDLVLKSSMHMIYSILYIIIGLSLTAMCIDVVQQKLTVMFKEACEKVMVLVEDSESDLESSVPKSF